MKRLLTLLLALVLVLGLVGCTQNGGQEGGNEPAADSSEGYEAAQGMLDESNPNYRSADVLGSLALHGDVPPTKLPLTGDAATFTYWYASGTLSDAQMETFNDGEMWQVAEQRTGIHIDWEHPSSTGTQEAFNLMIASNLLPDLIENRGWYAGLGSLENAVELGYFTDLAPYLDSCLPHVKGLSEANPNLRRDVFTESGYLPGGPGLVQEISIRVGTSLVVRRDLLESTGYTGGLPETFGDMHDMLVHLRDHGIPGAFGLDPTGTFDMSLMLSGLGISSDWYLENGKVVYSRTTDAYRYYIEQMRDWYNEGLIYPDFFSQTSWFDMIQGPMIRDEIAVCAMWPAYTGNLMGNIFGGSETFFLKAFKDPLRTADPSAEWLASTDTEHLRSSMNSCTAISSSCKDVELACKWVDYWYSAEGALLANYGARQTTGDTDDETAGTFYYDETGRPMLTSWMLGYTGSYSLATALTKYAMQLAMYEIVDHVTDGYTPELKEANQELMQLYNEDLAAKVNTEGHYPSGAILTSDESTRYSSKYNDIDTFADETTLRFITGAAELTDASWQAYVDQITGLGIDECISLKQVAYDRYMAR